MIQIHELNGSKFVCSFDMYNAVGYNKAVYSRWLKSNIYGYAEKGVDYFDKQESASGLPNKSKAVKYLLTFELAVAICLLSKTEKSKKLKKWLQQNR